MSPESVWRAGLEVAGPEGTRALGARLARLLRAGDLVLLSGALGAGKTTLAQGIGSAMGVRGRISSPTFVIARLHPALGDGPDLIHVDAYRISSLEEVDALDLESSMEESVTLVEWGEGKGADAGGARAVTDLTVADDGRRTIAVTAFGPRWAGADLNALRA